MARARRSELKVSLPCISVVFWALILVLVAFSFIAAWARGPLCLNPLPPRPSVSLHSRAPVCRCARVPVAGQSSVCAPHG